MFSFPYFTEWVWSWSHGGFVKREYFLFLLEGTVRTFTAWWNKRPLTHSFPLIVPVNKKVPVVLLSPPDVDKGVSGLVNGLALHLQSHGFNVSVEQWSRMEQCALGPLPWLYSQLKPNSRVVLILTRKALEKAEEWTREHKQDIKAKWGDTDVPQILSPYTDVFMGSLCIIEKEKQLARVHQRFILVKFDTHSGSCKNLPKLLEGLTVFHLPSQTHDLLAELTVRETERTSGERAQVQVDWRLKRKLRWRQCSQTVNVMINTCVALLHMKDLFIHSMDEKHQALYLTSYDSWHFL